MKKIISLPVSTLEIEKTQ